MGRFGEEAIQLYQIKHNLVHTFFMVVTTRKTGIAGHEFDSMVRKVESGLTSITIDAIPIKEINLIYSRKAIGFVPQDPFLVLRQTVLHLGMAAW